LKIKELLEKAGRTPVTCHRSDSAQDAATKLQENGVGAMPVLSSDGTLVGMISERDLVREFSKHGAELTDLTVGDILTKSVIFMAPSADLSDAMRAMHQHGFRHVPILDAGKLIGVISIRDLLALGMLFAGTISERPAVAEVSA
jgi:CBS domain-containing protein